MQYVTLLKEPDDVIVHRIMRDTLGQFING
jgi:hypothetical protein